MANAKRKYWGAILYPESLPTNWIDILNSTGVPIAISPLHNLDVFDTGELKKAHYHIIMAFPNTTTYNVAKEITDSLSQPFPTGLLSVKGAFEYLTHKNEKNKVKYNENEIQFLNGFNINDYIPLTSDDVLDIKFNIVKIIRDNNFDEMYDLINYCIDNGLKKEFEVISNCSYFYQTILTSYRNRGADDV